MHARILSVAVFFGELSTVLGSYCSLANKIPVDTRRHFLDSMFTAPVHGQSITRSRDPYTEDLPTDRPVHELANRKFVYPLLTTRFQGFQVRWVSSRGSVHTVFMHSTAKLRTSLV